MKRSKRYNTTIILAKQRTLERPQKRKSNVGSGQAGVVLGKQRDFSRREIANVSQKTSLRPMCSPKYDIWLLNVVIVKSDGPEVENSSKSHGEEDF